jgi:hypothetical protein
MLDAHAARVHELFVVCKGNIVRVHEELVAAGIELGYPTLTAFCRRQGLGKKKKKRVGQYHFEPGEEMQHDTSPHVVKLAGGREQRVDCASLVLCFSRRKYAQVYPRWSRLECRGFLSEAIAYLGGAADQCMLDNSTVVIGHGTGKNAVPAPAMKALSDRFGFEFVAHTVGDADRSARVERPFHHIENNFYPGRTFADLADLNQQLRVWCDEDNARFRRRLGASHDELWATEKPCLKPLPLHIPEVYDLHRRRVDVEGFVSLHTNRYSVDTELIGRHLELREGLVEVRFFDGHRLAEVHQKQRFGARSRVTLDKHRRQWRERQGPPPALPEERILREQGLELSALVDALKVRQGGNARVAIRKLHRIWVDYPTDAVAGAAAVALEYGLLDLDRIERLVLRRVAGEFFRLPTDQKGDGDE